MKRFLAILMAMIMVTGMFAVAASAAEIAAPDVADLQTALEDAIAEKYGTEAELETAVTDAQTAVEAITNEDETGTLDVAKADLEAAEEAVVTLNEELKVLEEAATPDQTAIDAKKAAIKTAEDAVTDAAGAVADLEDDLAEAEAALAEAEQALAEFEALADADLEKFLEDLAKALEAEYKAYVDDLLEMNGIKKDSDDYKKFMEEFAKAEGELDLAAIVDAEALLEALVAAIDDGELDIKAVDAAKVAATAVDADAVAELEDELDAAITEAAEAAKLTIALYKYVVTYYVGGEVYKTVNVTDGGKIKIEAKPDLDGYTYDYDDWKDDAGKVVKAGTEITVDKNVDLYADTSITWAKRCLPTGIYKIFGWVSNWGFSEWIFRYICFGWLFGLGVPSNAVNHEW